MTYQCDSDGIVTELHFRRQHCLFEEVYRYGICLKSKQAPEHTSRLVIWTSEGHGLETDLLPPEARFRSAPSKQAEEDCCCC